MMLIWPYFVVCDEAWQICERSIGSSSNLLVANVVFVGRQEFQRLAVERHTDNEFVGGSTLRQPVVNHMRLRENDKYSTITWQKDTVDISNQHVCIASCCVYLQREYIYVRRVARDHHTNNALARICG